MTKSAGMEDFYEKMGGESKRSRAKPVAYLPAVTPEEAAVPFADFVEQLDMSMTGKHWAPSEFF